jgi:photosystem II stability/assembly factor-like uncharacterized protein
MPVLILPICVTLHAVTLDWVPLGDPGVGGRITSLAVSPHNSNIVLAGGDILAVARSSDGGSNWDSTSGFSGTQEIEDFTFHPSDTAQVWVGTVNGPYKSADAGITWTKKRTGFPAQSYGTFVAPVQQVVVDADNGTRLLAFTGNRRGSNGINANTNVGLCYVSTDGGENWASLSTLSSGSNVYHVVYKTGSGNTLYAATAAGFYRSGDDGVSWTKITAGLPTGAISWVTVSPANGNTLWVTSPDNGVYQSTDGGTTFAARNGTSPSNLPVGSAQNWGNVECSPINASVLYACSREGNRGTWRSTDAGATWGKGTTSGGSPYPNYQDCSVLALDPDNTTRAFTGTNTDIWRTTNGSTWTNVSSTVSGSGWAGTGYSGQVPFEFKWNPWNLNEAMMCAMDSGKFITRDNFDSWVWGGGGRGTGLPDWNGLVDVAFTNTSGASEVIYLTMNQNGDNRLLRTANGGASWSTVTAPTTSGSYTSVVAHPTQTNRVWVVRNGDIYYSSTSGSSWTNLSSAMTGVGVLVADKDCTRFYAAGDDVFKSTDGTAFTDLNYPLDNVNRVKIEPGNVDRIYVVNRTGSNSYDRGVRLYNGTSWSTVVADGASSINNISEVAIDPSDTSRILVGTTVDPFTSPTGEQGVWMREGGVWTQQNLGLAARRITTLTFRPDGSGVVVAGVSGRGFFATNTNPPITLNGLAADGEVSSAAAGDGGGTVGSITGGTSRVGKHISGGTTLYNEVIVFQLPSVGSISNPFASASFSVGLTSNGNTFGNFSVDLYGLGTSGSSAISGADYFVGGNDTTDASKIVDNFVSWPNSGSTPSTGVKTTAAAALVNYLNAQYNGGAGAGLYVFFRLSPDTAPAQFKGGVFATSENATATLRPTIVLTR